MRIVVSLLVLVVVLPGCLSSTGTSETEGRVEEPALRLNRLLLDMPMPEGSQVSSRGDAEPLILVDRKGEALYIGSAQGLHVSMDGGQTWVRRTSPFARHCDGFPLAQDADGVLYTAMTCNTLEVARTVNRGESWLKTTIAADGYPDRPWIVAEGRGEVTLLYHSFSTLSEVCWRSSDGARTFTERSLLPAPRAPGNLALDEAGRIHYATRATSLHVLVSIPVKEAQLVRWTAPCGGSIETVRLPPGSIGPFDPVAVDPTGTNAWVAQSPQGGIQLVGFRDMDPASQKILRISPPELRHNQLPAIAYREGEIAVAWYGTEYDPSVEEIISTVDTTPWNVYVARVRNFWDEEPQVRLDRLTVEPNYLGRLNNRDLLDYMGLQHDNEGNLHVAYGHWKSQDITQRGIRYAFLEKPSPP